MLDYIRSILTLIFAVSFMYILLDCEFKRKQDRYLLGLYGIVIIICNVLVLLYFGYANSARLYPLLVQLPVFLAFLFISRFNAIKVFFVHLTAVALTTSFVLIGLVISSFLGSNRLIMNVVCYVLYIPTWLTFYRYLRPTFIYMLRNTDKGWYGFCTIPLSYTMLFYIISKYNLDTVMFNTKTFVIIIMLLFLTLSVYFQIFLFFRQTREQHIMQNEQNLLRTQVAAAQMHLEALKESQEKTILYRHDMRHHLALIGANLADNKSEDAQKYIEEVEENIDGTEGERFCNNYTVNLIISYYIAIAKNEGIKVETQIDLPPKNAISDMDLCVIFANAIENATNACKRIPVKNARALNVVCETKNDQLFIQITNNFNGTVKFADDLPVSTEENHGLGTKSIASVVKRYGGKYSFTAEDGIFMTSIIL